MQETQFELWVPVNHANQLQHWTAATDALDHVILTAAALESVLEGMLIARTRGGGGGRRPVQGWVWGWVCPLSLQLPRSLCSKACFCQVLERRGKGRDLGGWVFSSCSYRVSK